MVGSLGWVLLMNDLEILADLELRELGEVYIQVPCKPPSITSKGKKKKVKEIIKELIRIYDFTFTGDVKIEIDWFVDEQSRYESDSTPDIDNTTKPILDALCGKNGILIDDCQVQSVSSIWLDRYKRNENFSIRIKPHFFGERIKKNGLVFIEYSKGLCFPFNFNGIPYDVQLMVIDKIDEMITARKKMMEMGVDYYVASGVMPSQRVFHISKIKDFPIEDFESFKEKIKRNISKDG